jgi:hypothetical protein
MGWKGFWKGYDWLSRADFANTLAGGFFDWRTWVISLGGSAVTFLWATIQGRDPLSVWIAAVVVFAGIALICMAAGLFLAGKPERVPAHEAAVDNWKGLLEAIDEFADKSLLKTRDKWQTEFMETFEQRFQSDQELAKLLASSDSDQDKIGHQTRRKKVAVLGHSVAEDELRRVWSDIREDIRKKLEAGRLVAKGIPAPYSPGKGEIEIAAHEWRILEISPNERAEVYEKGAVGCRYVGVVIGLRNS